MKDLLLIEDDPIVLATLRRALRREGYRVHTATTGRMGVEVFSEQRPDMVVLDLGLPELDGFGVLQELRSHSSVPVMVLTANSDMGARVQAFSEGADDFLIKPFAVEELLARLQAIWRRASPGSTADRLSFQNLHLDPMTQEANAGEEPLSLTRREFELLGYFMRHPRQVLTREQLLTGVWGYEHHASSNVVDVYVRALRTKLAPSGAARWLVTVRGVGYTLRT